MFGCIAAGRPVQTNIIQVDHSRYMFELMDASSINHIVIFLLGQPFPEGFGATVHFLWPSTTNPSWVFLGILTNDKPSAIFKLGGTKNMSRSTDALMEMDNPGPFEATSQTVAQLGISIEPLSTVLSQADSLPSRISLGPPGQLTVRSQSFNASQVASKILENFYNYCCSFATALPTGANVLFNLNTPYMEQTYIPMKALQDWYKNTLQKVQSDPSLFKEMDM